MPAGFFSAFFKCGGFASTVIIQMHFTLHFNLGVGSRIFCFLSQILLSSALMHETTCINAEESRI